MSDNVFKSASTGADVTHILQRAVRGDGKPAEELLPQVYAELRKLAAHRMAQEAAGNTLQPTAVVHEAWLRLVRAPNLHWNNRNHFFMAAAEAMRRILIERARQKSRLKRGGDQQRVALASDMPVAGKWSGASPGLVISFARL